MASKTINYTISDKIKAFDRPKGTVLKIQDNNRVYVYENFKYKGDDGKWHNRTGKVLGYMDEELGFIANGKAILKSDDTCYDFGVYALIYFLCDDLLARLNRYFNQDDSFRLFSLASIHFSEGYLPLEYLPDKFKNSLFNIMYPNLKMGKTAISSIYENLGKKSSNQVQFQNDLIIESTKKLAIDGHAISSSSIFNDLTAKGNKVLNYKNGQFNVLMAYDIETKTPILSKIYEGDAKDNKSIQDILSVYEFKNILFIVDKGFYSDKNLQLFSSNDCHYIIPLQQNTQKFKALTNDFILDYQENTFRYSAGNKDKLIVYKEMKFSDSTCYIFRDIDENSKECADYKRKIEAGVSNCSIDEYNKLKNTFGTLFIQTNYESTPKDIFNLYKDRWSIETFYDTYKYRLDVNQICLHNYYELQGLSFVMLLSSIIDSKFRNIIRNNKTISINSIPELIKMADYIKIQKTNGRWQIMNLISKRETEFKKLGISLKDINDLLSKY